MALFGRKKARQQDAEQPNPQLDAELERVSELALPQLAAEVMTKGFSSDDDPSDDGVQADDIADEFCPRPKATLRDTTVRAQVLAAKEASDPTTTRAKFVRLQDLVAEGLQALEQASLVQSKASYDGVATNIGYTTTRLGRYALERNAVDRILAGGTL